MKLRVAQPSLPSAFSSTKRMEGSSSTIQIGFIGGASFPCCSVDFRGPQGRGMRMRKSVRPGWLSHSISPWWRSEEHTSELQSPCNLVCRLLLEKKKKE